MARRKDSPQKAAMREMMRDYLKNNDISIKDGTDVNSIMRDMMSVLLEGALDEELDEELGYSKYDYRNKETDNSRNGHSSKTMHTSYGDMDVAIPRDRNGDYEPQLIKKYQNTVTQDMEEKILSMYAKGMTTGDIESHMRELYDIDISDSTISRITDKILPIVKEWQERPLEEVYAVVFMDAIHYHVRSEGRIVKRAVYIALGIDMNGKKDVLGMYVGENESAKFWLSIMNGLKNRGVEDILIACVDGLNGFPQAIEAVYPKTEIQASVVHVCPHALVSEHHKYHGRAIERVTLSAHNSGIQLGKHVACRLIRHLNDDRGLTVHSGRSVCSCFNDTVDYFLRRHFRLVCLYAGACYHVLY